VIINNQKATIDALHLFREEAEAMLAMLEVCIMLVL
jgi:hypothetical protein